MGKVQGFGWPGYTVIKTKKGVIRVPSPTFWDSGLGQHFYGLGCYLCSDHTNTPTDISLADPWTLPHELIRRLGGATLVVIRSEKGLEVFEGAVKAGYIRAVEVNPIYAIQYTTLLKLSKRVLGRNISDYMLSPGFTTITHELLYYVGRFLASRESLWSLLRLYHKTIRSFAFILAYALDYKLQTTWAKVNMYITLMQKKKLSST